MKVLKFGGSSLAADDGLRNAVELVNRVAQEERVVVVVSALGGVTEILDEASRAASRGNRTVLHRYLADLRELHENSDTSLLSELEHVLFGVAAVGELTARTRDLVLSFGERLSAPLVAGAIGAGARVFTGKAAGIVTDDRWGEADPLREVTRFELKQRLSPALEEGQIPVVTGFIGATQHGATTTLGRGGSDFTATLIGDALGADEVWLCSDVDGVRAVDPRLVPDSHQLDEISFDEALEMVQFGAKGIHPRALEPAVDSAIPVRIRNTFNPDKPGTWIGPNARRSSQGVARSILMVSDVALITVEGAAMVGRPGTAARVFSTIAEAGGNILMISQSVSEAGISVALKERDVDRVRAALEGSLVRSGYIHGLSLEPDVAIIAVVGEAMRGTPGVAAEIFTAVASESINVAAIAQGSSELSISFIVSADRGAEAVQVLYEDLVVSA